MPGCFFPFSISLKYPFDVLNRFESPIKVSCCAFLNTLRRFPKSELFLSIAIFSLFFSQLRLY